WDFSPVEYVNASSEGKILTASIENTNYCNLDCKYCFRGGALPSVDRQIEGQLLREELFKLVDDLALLGVKAIYITGAGEPLIEKDLPQLLIRIAEKKIIPVVATNGSLITPEMVKIFKKTNSSVVLKLNTFDSSKQDEIVQRAGYSKKRDTGLELLINAGFNKPSKTVQTKLGINSIVFKGNINEVLDILRFCRKNNIMPVMSTFIPAGRTKSNTDEEVSLKDFLDISRKARKIDEKEFNIKYDRLLPYLGGISCSQCGKASIFVSITGDIYDCPGQLVNYGNVRTTSIKEAVANIQKNEVNTDFGCPLRNEYWKRTKQT
ncbi:MAG: radical SAM protein, partial [archaeon]